MHVHCICGIVVFTFLHNYEIVYSACSSKLRMHKIIFGNWFGVLDYGLEL